MIVCEVDPIKAADALMHGLRVMPLNQAVPEGDIILTVTGGKHVIRQEHYERMKGGVILANAGHFKIEFDLDALLNLSVEQKEMRHNITGFLMADGRWLNLLGDGDLVNIACADGHPAEIMDTSFALQALSGKYIALNHADLGNDVHRVPEEIDDEVARLKLKGSGVSIDELLPEQKAYLESWEKMMSLVIKNALILTVNSAKRSAWKMRILRLKMAAFWQSVRCRKILRPTK